MLYCIWSEAFVKTGYHKGKSQLQTEKLLQWIERTGLGVAMIPLLEITRALGFVAAHALLLGQPLLSGLVQDSSLTKATVWLQDTQQIEQLMKRFEKESEQWTDSWET